MSRQFGFFDSVAGDRKYTATQISEYFKGLVSNGILPNPSTSLQVMASSDLNTEETMRSVRVEPGKAWINGRWFETDAAEIILLDAADVLLSRIDRIVVRLDYASRMIYFAVVKGTPSSTPVAPAITRTSEVIDLCLAEVLIRPNQTLITQSSITDTRADVSLCGWVTSLIKEIDTTTLLNQYQAMYKEYYEKSTAEFEAWFDDLQESLSTVVMLRRYTNVTLTVEENQSVVPIGITQYDPVIDILEVYVNGILQDKDITYTSDANSITFINPLPVIGTRITKVVYKNVNGEDATTVQEEVEELQNNMAKLMKYNYFATGEADNVAINSIINDFYNGTGRFAGVDENASLELKIHGNLGITEADYNGAKAIFYADKTNASSKKCTLDFNNASKIIHSTANAIVGVAMSGTIIKGLSMTITSTASAYGTSGTNVLERCVIDVTGNLAVGFSGNGVLMDCTIETKSTEGVSYAISTTTGVTRITGGSFGAYRTAGKSNLCAAIYMNVADAYLLCTGAYFHSWSKTGFEQQYAYCLQSGKYSINSSIRAVDNLIASGATGQIVGEIDLTA